MRAWLLVLVTLCLVRAHFPSGETTAAEGEQDLDRPDITSTPESTAHPQSAEMLPAGGLFAVPDKERNSYGSSAQQRIRRSVRDSNGDTLQGRTNNSINEKELIHSLDLTVTATQTSRDSQPLGNSSGVHISGTLDQRSEEGTTGRERMTSSPSVSAHIDLEEKESAQMGGEAFKNSTHYDASDGWTANIKLNIKIQSQEINGNSNQTGGLKSNSSVLLQVNDVQISSAANTFNSMSSINLERNFTMNPDVSPLNRKKRDGAIILLSEVPIHKLPGVGRSMSHSLDDFQCSAAKSSCLLKRNCGFSTAYKCSCDEKCAVYRDCCEDFPAVCPEVYQKAMELLRNYSGLDVECLPDSNNKVISGCSASFRGSQLESLCKSAFQFGHSDLAPVTDKRTGLNFNNLHCALCNGADEVNLVRWQQVFTLNPTLSENIESGDQVKEAFQMALDEQQGAWLSWAPETAARRSCSRSATRSCPASSDLALQRACNFSDSYVKDSLTGIVYANRYCLLCRGLFECDKLILKDIGGDRTSTQGFSALLNWGMAGDTENGLAILRKKSYDPRFSSLWNVTNCKVNGTKVVECLIRTCLHHFEIVEQTCHPPSRDYQIYVWMTVLTSNSSTSRAAATRTATTHQMGKDQHLCDVKSLVADISAVFTSHIKAVVPDARVNVSASGFNATSLKQVNFVFTFSGRFTQRKLFILPSKFSQIPPGLLPTLEAHGISGSLHVCTRFSLGMVFESCPSEDTGVWLEPRGNPLGCSPGPRAAAMTSGLPPWTSVALPCLLHLLGLASPLL